MNVDLRARSGTTPYRHRTRPGYLTVNEMLDRVGITYRQMDYWLRSGAIHAAVEARGSGTRRQFSEDQIPALRLVACVSRLGLHYVTNVVGAVWAQIEQDPGLLDSDVLFLTGTGLTTEPGFGYCLPRSAWAEPLPEHAIA